MSKSSMRDVANHAGVSIATVSHVLNNTRYVADETRNRVLESIRVLEYTPDVMARSFKTGRRNLVGFIVPDIANEYFATIIETIESIISKKNYKLVIANTRETKQRELENLRVLGNGIVDGIIIASTLDQYAELENTVPSDIPLLFVDRKLSGCPHSTIIVSSYDAMYKGVERLIRDGHSRIGYITGLARLSTTVDRLDAYRAAMEANHLPVEETFVRFGDSLRSNIAQHLNALLEAGCTALVVSNNVMADEVLFHLTERGMQPGIDIALLGYNDSAHLQYNMRNIHYITQPATDLGRTAGQQILELLEEPNLPVRNTILQATFMPYESRVSSK